MCNVLAHRLSVDGLRAAASSRSARRAYHTHLAPWPRPDQEPSELGAADNGSIGSTSAAAAPAASGPQLNDSAVPPATHGGPVGLEQGPWDTAEFTDDELRAQMTRVLGGSPWEL